MSAENKPSRPFSNGTEYEVFLSCFCDRCRRFRLEGGGVPARSSCKTEKAMCNARFDITLWPKNDIVETADGRHICLRFSGRDTKTGYKQRAMAVSAGQTSLFSGEGNGETDG